MQKIIDSIIGFTCLQITLTAFCAWLEVLSFYAVSAITCFSALLLISSLHALKDDIYK